MSRVALAALLAAGLLVADASGRARSLPAPVTLDGVGGVVPGMSAAEVGRRWGVTLDLQGTRGSTCQTARVTRGGMRGYALFERGRFGAVWFERGVWTPSGIRIGSRGSQLVRAYEIRLRFRPHEYQLGAQYAFLTRRSRPHWQIRFVLSADGRVTEIGFGGRAVTYVEGCS